MRAATTPIDRLHPPSCARTGGIEVLTTRLEDNDVFEAGRHSRTRDIW
jgi:hypothetical protein